MLKKDNTLNHIALKSLNHWITQRATAIFLIPSLLVLLYYFVDIANNTQFDTFNGINLLVFIGILTSIKPLVAKIAIFGTCVILCIHLIEGVENIIVDYVHNEKTKIIIWTILKCIQIEIIKNIYLFMFL